MTLVDRIMGSRLATADEAKQTVGPIAGIPMLGLDALSSAAYGPEAALAIMLGIGSLGAAYIVPITAIIVALLLIVFFSYRQTIPAYPNGGGSYTVARENLGQRFGLLAAASLMVDYILNVAVGIAAGIGALISAVPALHPYILPLCLAVLLVITLVNLHGVRESGVAFLAPTYLFVGTLGLVILIGLVKAALAGGSPVPVEAPPDLPAIGAGVGFWLLLRAFANGCTAMTGVEAISNGITAFRQPAVGNAKRTLAAVVAILSVLLIGIAVLCRAYGIVADDPDAATYQSVLSRLTAAVTGRGPFYYLTMAGVIAVVCLSANTSFADFPRLCRLLALDNFLPYTFASRSRRLVNSTGVLVLAFMSGALLVAFGGVTDRLIPLFAIGAFAAFTLNQAGMVAHWRSLDIEEGGRHAHNASMAINAVGAVSTGLVLLVVLATKFLEGAWVVLLLIPALYLVFTRVQQHYAFVRAQTDCTTPLAIADIHPPVVAVVMRRWSTITGNALRFALSISDDVVAIHVNSDAEEGRHLAAKWSRFVDAPLRQGADGGTRAVPRDPRIVVINVPWRLARHGSVGASAT